MPRDLVGVGLRTNLVLSPGGLRSPGPSESESALGFVFETPRVCQTAGMTYDPRYSVSKVGMVSENRQL